MGSHAEALHAVTGEIVAGSQVRPSACAFVHGEGDFQALFDQPLVGIASLSPQGEWLEVNEVLCDLMACSPLHLIGRSWLDRVPPEDLEAARDAWEALATGEVSRLDLQQRLLHADGHGIDVRVAMEAVRHRGETGSRHVLAAFLDTSESKRSADLLWRQTHLDSLTELPNRSLFQERLAEALARMRAGCGQLALLCIDLDDFKDVNDTLGHELGDVLLANVARRISGTVRGSDLAARLGGDAFAVILTDTDGPEGAERVARSVVARLGEAFRVRDEWVYLSASVGFTCFPEDADSADALLRNADQALYAAKYRGRSQVCRFAATMQEDAQQRQRLISDLHQALRERQFEVWFQPVIDLASGRICGAEALLRWRHRERGMIPPLEFIGLAEELGLIVPIGDWVFQEAAAWTKRWVDRFGADFWVSVNHSPVQFRTGSGLRGRALALQQLGLDGRHITVEITESLLLDATDALADQLQELHAAGMRVAIDDFGTGYSSLAYLQRLHIDCLKIDRAFVRDMGEARESRAIAEAIVAIAHTLGLSVVAEGVETAQQLELLRAAGCDAVQGFLFSQAVPGAEFEALLVAQAAGADAAFSAGTPRTAPPR